MVAPMRPFATFPEQEDEEAAAKLAKKKATALPKPFNPRQSKYGLERQEQN